MNKITKTALIDAAATALYIIAVGLFMFYGGSHKIGQKNSFIIPIAILMLFTLSAAVTSYFMFAKPAQWYIDGKKKEALSLVTQTLIIFFAITVFALGILVYFSR